MFSLIVVNGTIGWEKSEIWRESRFFDWILRILIMHPTFVLWSIYWFGYSKQNVRWYFAMNSGTGVIFTKFRFLHVYSALSSTINWFRGSRYAFRLLLRSRARSRFRVRFLLLPVHVWFFFPVSNSHTHTNAHTNKANSTALAMCDDHAHAICRLIMHPHTVSLGLNGWNDPFIRLQR